jgi:hypothetical protein
MAEIVDISLSMEVDVSKSVGGDIVCSMVENSGVGLLVETSETKLGPSDSISTSSLACDWADEETKNSVVISRFDIVDVTD